MYSPYFVLFLAVFLTINFSAFAYDFPTPFPGPNQDPVPVKDEEKKDVTDDPKKEEEDVKDNPDSECALHYLIPGLAKSAKAVDITSLEYFPKDQDMGTLNGFGNAVLDLTCSKKRVWINQVSDIQYLEPDQVASVNMEPNGQLVESVTVHQSLDSVRSVLDIHGGAAVNNATLWGGSLNGGYKQTEDTLQTGNFTIIDVSAMATAYTINYKPFSVLKTVEGFPEMINQLAECFKTDSSLYNMILDTYGTHYLSSVKLGGYLVMRTLVNTSYLSTGKGQDIFGNIAANFKKMVAANGSLEGEYGNSSSRVVFDQNTRTNYYYYGGHEGVKNGAMSPEEFKEWMVSVHKDPWLFDAKLTPISYLIKKANIRKQMDLAISVKQNKAVLLRFANALKLIHKAHDPVMTTISKLLSETAPAFDKILDVSEKVEKLINDNSRLDLEEVKNIEEKVKDAINGNSSIILEPAN